MFDAELYRSKDEVKEAKKRDPILLFTEYLKEKGMLSDADLEAIEAEVAKVVQHAVDFAEESPWEALEDLERFVYTERT
jgi:TPP-dependent pyruvate/acetoin dehydrogenase alpha subunit